MDFMKRRHLGASLYEAKNRNNNIIIRFWKELGVYRELRNVLIHEQVESYKLAEPHANINERLGYISGINRSN